ncbi:hypothetical protein L9F63_001625 [Diploptera punctata]|uniref:Transcription factor Adf-1 n=1 Tax=Diploptera punctata TaxID=6984 RepID=A0AAD8EIT8_DIPPU|nr:hypothetical protein L9F63_001625 [Diploptera punctata]
MRDDPDFNITFVELIKEYPCLYDTTLNQYSNRNVQDQAWHGIAEELSESVEACKERWKNLRSCYARYLKSTAAPSGSAAKSRKPYYLSEYLNFLDPFSKSRKSKSNIPESSEHTDPHGEEEDQKEEITEAPEADNSESESVKPPHHSEILAKKRKINTKNAVSLSEVNKCALEYFQNKRAHSSSSDSEKDPDRLFVLSLAPDMKDMTKSQKLRFKIGVLNLMKQILNENTPSP